MDKSTITGKLISAARTLVGMSQTELAAAANISVPTLKRMEASRGPVPGLANNVLAVVTALEQAGIQFVDNGDVAAGKGVALTKDS